MGFDKRRMESERAAVAAKEAEARRALGPQIVADSEHLIATCAAGSPHADAVLPTIGAAIGARHLVALGALSGLPDYQCR